MVHQLLNSMINWNIVEYGDETNSYTFDLGIIWRFSSWSYASIIVFTQNSFQYHLFYSAIP